MAVQAIGDVVEVKPVKPELLITSGCVGEVWVIVFGVSSALQRCECSLLINMMIRSCDTSTHMWQVVVLPNIVSSRDTGSGILASLFDVSYLPATRSCVMLYGGNKNSSKLVVFPENRSSIQLLQSSHGCMWHSRRPVRTLQRQVDGRRETDH